MVAGKGGKEGGERGACAGRCAVQAGCLWCVYGGVWCRVQVRRGKRRGEECSEVHVYVWGRKGCGQAWGRGDRCRQVVVATGKVQALAGMDCNGEG